ncbi:hypothetical protein EV361DRAFT_922270 [Lentinula raphanica]|nr:hypothetical protein F5880DRAFT_1580669 [Lentinula raphanica]KAJ3969172.1 hypothetical protein EV361DRAFT_922270 [Lentinula raphanica]
MRLQTNPVLWASFALCLFVQSVDASPEASRSNTVHVLITVDDGRSISSHEIRPITRLCQQFYSVWDQQSQTVGEFDRVYTFTNEITTEVPGKEIFASHLQFSRVLGDSGPRPQVEQLEHCPASLPCAAVVGDFCWQVISYAMQKRLTIHLHNPNKKKN